MKRKSTQETENGDEASGGGSSGSNVQTDPAMTRLVQCLAWRLLARIPRNAGIEMSDLIQAGNLGLAQAAQLFSAEHGAPLPGYAKFRIRGEMLDTVRRHAGRGSHGGLRRAVTNDGEPEAVDCLAAPPENSPHGLLAKTQRTAILNEEIARLPMRDRTVVGLRYSKGFNLREIGQFLRVKESRACQLHQAAIGRLRRALAGRGVTGLSQLM